MRAFPALAFAAVMALPLAAQARPPAKPVDPTLGKEALLAVIQTGKVWCSDWREADQSCEEVVFLEADKDRVSQVRRYRMSAEGELDILMRQIVSFEGDKLCWTYRFAEMDVVILNDGARAPAEQAAPIRGLMAGIMADLEGKKACESFIPDAASGDLDSKVTLDGEAAPDFSTRFRLLAPETRVKLRPMFEPIEDLTTT
jgi:hypothetical protein